MSADDLEPYRLDPDKPQFSIGGVFDPIGLHDQLKRACLVVDRLVARDLIGGKERRLLVIGGGAAGVGAAIRAARLGVDVTLVEQASHWFARQWGCVSRWLSPTFYDWPHPHWVERGWPADSRGPFGFDEGRADDLAAAWQAWRDDLDPPSAGRIKEFLHWRVESLTDLGESRVRALLVRVGPTTAAMTHRSHELEYAAVLHATGPLEERTSLDLTSDGENPPQGTPGFRGYGFWETPLPAPHGEFVISGGGDGALQDLILHASVDEWTRPLFAALREPTADDVVHAQADHLNTAWQALEEALLEAERVATLARAGERDGEALALAALDATYARAVATLLDDPLIGPTLLERLHARLVPGRAVTLVHSKPYFTWCYPVNRLLAHLIRTVASPPKASGIQVPAFWPGHRVTQVISACAGHSCMHDPESCDGVRHDVTTIREPGWDGSSPPGPLPATTVLLRHGLLRPSRSIFGLLPLPPRYDPVDRPFARARGEEAVTTDPARP